MDSVEWTGKLDTAQIIGYVVNLSNGTGTAGMCEHCLATSASARSTVQSLVACVFDNTWQQHEGLTCYACGEHVVKWMPVDPIERCSECSGINGSHTVLRCPGRFVPCTVSPLKETMIHQERLDALGRLQVAYTHAVARGATAASVNKRDKWLAEHPCLCLPCARQRGEVKH